MSVCVISFEKRVKCVCTELKALNVLVCAMNVFLFPYLQKESSENSSERRLC